MGKEGTLEKGIVVCTVTPLEIACWTFVWEEIAKGADPKSLTSTDRS